MTAPSSPPPDLVAASESGDAVPPAEWEKVVSWAEAAGVEEEVRPAHAGRIQPLAFDQRQQGVLVGRGHGRSTTGG
jgi:hypothetical protein